MQDIAGPLFRGGIPAADIDALQSYWGVCPRLRHSLFKKRRRGYLDLSVKKSAIRSAIYDHPEFAAFVAGMNAHFTAWRKKRAAKLKALEPGCHPKEIIKELAESLLAHYAGKPLIDPYDIYQHMMDYWSATMQDDCYQIAGDGWQVKTARIIETDKKGREKDKGWTCDLIPKTIIVTRYFAKDQAAIERLAAELEAVTARLAELEEEHGGEEGVFADLDRVNRANVAARLREIKGDRDARAEAAVLNDWLALNDRRGRSQEAPQGGRGRHRCAGPCRISAAHRVGNQGVGCGRQVAGRARCSRPRRNGPRQSATHPTRAGARRALRNSPATDGHLCGRARSQG